MYIKPFFAAIIFLLAVPLSASTDVQFLRGLIDRSLFESVDHFCNEEFRAEKTGVPRKLALATEWVRSRTRQMILAPPERRDGIRKRLTELETELLAAVTNETDPEALISFRFQLAISDASLGDWLRLEADVAAEDECEAKIKEARKILFDSLERFKRCDEEIGALRRRSNGDIPFEKRSLAQLWAIRSQWSMAQVSLALSYPPGNDRTFSLNRAVELLTELAGLGISDPVVFRSRIELARCYRLLGETEKSKEQLVILDGIRLTGETLLLAQAELIRHYLSTGAVLEAMKIFDTKTVAGCPDYDIACLELLLAENARIRQSEKPENIVRKESETMLGRILELVYGIDNRFGPYWGRRARMVLSSSEDERKTTDAALIRLLGDERFQSGYPSEAVRLYDRASRIAESQGDEQIAFGCGSASVAVWAEILDRLTVRLKNVDGVSPDETAAARQRLIDSARNLSLRFPEHLDAPEYHLKAVDLTAEAVRQKQAELSAYVELLKEHAEHWPDSRKVPPALLRAGLLVEQQGDKDEALTILERVPVTSDAGLKAIQAARRCFEALADTADEGDREIVQKEAKWFESRLGENAPGWTEAEVIAAFRAAECRLKIFADAEDKTQVVEHSKAAEKLLRNIEQGANLSTTSKARCQVLLVQSLADQGRHAEAAEVLRKLDDDRIKDLTPEERRVFQRTRAQLLAETGKTQDAVNLLAVLLKRYPNDLAVWETLAEVLTRQSDEKSLNRALQCWSKIVADLETTSKAKSERWWTARERMLDIRLKLGQPEEAKNEFEVLRLLHPELGGPGRKARLEKRFGNTNSD